MRTFTVIDVFKELRVEPIPEITWAVGAAARDRYEQIFGHAPIKALRKKTCGAGSHCFAIYPQEFRPIVEEMVSKVAQEAARQSDLFG